MILEKMENGEWRRRHLKLKFRFENAETNCIFNLEEQGRGGHTSYWNFDFKLM